MVDAAEATTPALKRTPLHALNCELGGRMVPFAGYEMPVQFPAGVLKEHLHTRAAAGLFDVSHMGQITLRAKSGHLLDAALALERLFRSTSPVFARAASATGSSPTTAAAFSTI